MNFYLPKKFNSAIVNQNKSGQATLILVMVTMVAVLGIGITNSTKSKVNLKETVYSTQSDQSINCAEAGAEKALVALNNLSNGANVPGNFLADNDLEPGDFGANFAFCNISVQVNNYPQNNQDILIPLLENNSVQEIRFQGAFPNSRIYFRNNDGTNDGALAVYQYFTNGTEPQVERRFFNYMGTEVSDEFEDSSNSSNATYPAANGWRMTPAINFNQGTVLRLRPINDDYMVAITRDGVNASNARVGYEVISTSTVGSVGRTVRVIKYFNQLPAGFDEAVVDLD